MGIGTSIFLIAVGAILYWAVNEQVQGIEIQTVGLILLVVGIIGLVVSFLWTAMLDRRDPRVARRDHRDRDPYPPERDVYR